MSWIGVLMVGGLALDLAIVIAQWMLLREGFISVCYRLGLPWRWSRTKSVRRLIHRITIIQLGCLSL